MSQTAICKPSAALPPFEDGAEFVFEGLVELVDASGLAWGWWEPDELEERLESVLGAALEEEEEEEEELVWVPVFFLRLAIFQAKSKRGATLAATKENKKVVDSSQNYGSTRIGQQWDRSKNNINLSVLRDFIQKLLTDVNGWTVFSCLLLFVENRVHQSQINTRKWS